MKVATVTLNPALDLTIRADGWRQGDVNTAQGAQFDAGGKGVNVASFLADAGMTVTATGLLGADNPERFEALLRDKGVRDAFIRVPGATRIGVKVVDELAQETTDLNLPGLTPNNEHLQALQGTLDALAEDHDVFVLAGSLPPGAPQDLYVQLTARLRAAGRTVALDTSGAALRAALQAGALPHLLKPNIHELKFALDRNLVSDADLLAAARTLIARGAELVAVSMGERGALLVTAAEAVMARPPRVAVKSTVGAGDAMLSGLVNARARALTLHDTARAATSFSLGAITRVGAHLPDPETLTAFARQVDVRNADHAQEV
ncbi:1-phosphofructokinase [Deinococcus maricopensis]|uniref:1-phosphofructokinase n=1 Tax=Deinococcus maricopensis (strain DSM 21211 / LMG 22137 / NRRL B-23946 / LB-34) TaxID=709986 RepID=E8U927_DEIML|nr:1-phosphofructokinase [Deinococcus maricopensis]ADV67566.1 1-phosphofructokinase [Deinococcus maricopensis DSM 21211]